MVFWPKMQKLRDNSGRSGTLRGRREPIRFTQGKLREGSARADLKVGATIMATIMVAALHYVLETKVISDELRKCCKNLSN